ncbi:HD domain-containing protein [Bacillus taeanensis]|nr:HD domain-containing protein [Bacillus taeanensis]
MIEELISQENFLNYILNSIDEALIVVDHELNVKYVNPTAEMFLKLEGLTYKDKNFYSDLNLLEKNTSNKKTVLEEVMETGRAKKGIIRKTKNNKQLSINVYPLIEEGVKKGVLITAQDVTDLLAMQDELDRAFALTLPNSKVENKLKNTVEYKDRYDAETGMITITEIISDGGYRHVVNCLRLLSNLYQQGITKIIGIEKDQLVQAFIFHDLGKSQPILAVGDVVDPKEVFEDGKLHAYRGAEIAKSFYHLDDDIVQIIHFHHHGERELPETFPWRLRPMFRLFQLIDGLSAAMTRGEVEVHFTVQDCVITVTEINQRPQYNGTWKVDLFTGQRIKISDKHMTFV